MLTGDAQSCPILHQRDAVDVRHFGASDTLVYPAHDITQDALNIVVQLDLDLVSGQGCRITQRRRQDIFDSGEGSPGDLLLPLGDIDIVIMHRVERSSSGRGDPGTVCTRLQLGLLGLHHLPHRVGLRPHTLTDLRFSG